MINLCVPNKDFREVEALGAKWSEEFKVYQIDNRFKKINFSKWLPLKFLPLKKEKPNIQITPIPKTSCIKSLKNHIGKAAWAKLSSTIVADSGGVCRVCGSVERVGIMPVWYFDESSGVQRLMNFKCLCKRCRDISFGGFDKSDESIISLIMEMNGWSRSDVVEHFRKREFFVKKLEEKTWNADISLIFDKV